MRETTAVLVQYLRIRLMLECNMHDTLSEGKHKRMYYMVYRIIGTRYIIPFDTSDVRGITHDG